MQRLRVVAPDFGVDPSCDGGRTPAIKEAWRVAAFVTPCATPNGCSPHWPCPARLRKAADHQPRGPAGAAERARAGQREGGELAEVVLHGHPKGRHDHAGRQCLLQCQLCARFPICDGFSGTACELRLGAAFRLAVRIAISAGACDCERICDGGPAKVITGRARSTRSCSKLVARRQHRCRL